MATVIAPSHRTAAGDLDLPQAGRLLLGELLIRHGKISEDDVGRVITAQREIGLRFGEAARKLGLISASDLRLALAEQFEFPCVKSGQSKLDGVLACAHEPFGAYAEAVRSLRTHLLLQWFNNQPRALAVTSTRMRQGSTQLAANLAISFAQLGERTLLIDGNMRQPNIDRLFGVQSREGLATVLAGRGAAKDALVEVDGFNNLCLLCAGVDAPNPQELLSRVIFSYVMETIPTNFDVVIVDAPPTEDCADAELIAARSGGCMLVARRGDTRLSEIAAARQRLERTGASILGVVLVD